MEKKINLILGVIFLIGFVLAYYPGETISIQNNLSDSNLTWYIQNNNTIIEDLNISISLEQINISLPPNMAPGYFEVVFENKELEQVVVTSSHHSSGGGSNRKMVKNQSNISSIEIDASAYPRYYPESSSGQSDEEIPSLDKKDIIKTKKASQNALFWLILVLGLIFITLMIIWFVKRWKK